MIVDFMDGIKSASGTLCKTKTARVIVTTRRAPSTNPNKVRMFIRSNESYQRKTPLSEGEIAARNLFQRRQAYVKQLLADGTCKTKAEAWGIAKIDVK